MANVVPKREINRDIGPDAWSALQCDIDKAKLSFSNLLGQLTGPIHVAKRLEALVDNVFQKCKSSDRETFKLFACCMKYSDYLKTKHWENVRRQVLDAYEHACSFCCAKDDIHVHHRTYKRIGNEHWGDLVVLCKECHAVFHLNRKAEGQFEYGENQKTTEDVLRDKCRKQKEQKENDIQPATRQARNAQAAANQKRGLHPGMDDNHR